MKTNLFFSTNPQKMLDRYRAFFLPALTLVLIVVLTATFIQPKLTDILQQQQEIAQGQTRLDRLTQKSSLLSSLDVNQLRTKFKTMEGALPSEKDVPGFLVEMQKIANEASVSVDKVELSAGSLSTSSAQTATTNSRTLSKTVPSLDAKVTLTGTFGNLRLFLDKVSRVRRLVNIKGISLGGNQAQKASGSISLDFGFSLYYQALPTSLGEISQELPQITSDENKTYQIISAYPLYSTFEDAGSISVPVGKSDPFH